MICDTSADNATGWKVDKIKTENLENGQVEQAAKATNADKILAFDGTYGSLAQACLNMIYPVGSIYMSANNVSPQTFLGGTWEPWGAGKVPVGVDTLDSDFNTAEKTGGEKKHILSLDEIPSHNHKGTSMSSKPRKTGNSGSVYSEQVGVVDYSVDYTQSREQKEVNIYTDGAFIYLPNGETVTSEHGVCPNGGGASHNNLQPYITCYMWKRTA